MSLSPAGSRSAATRNKGLPVSNCFKLKQNSSGGTLRCFVAAISPVLGIRERTRQWHGGCILRAVPDERYERDYGLSHNPTHRPPRQPARILTRAPVSKIGMEPARRTSPQSIAKAHRSPPGPNRARRVRIRHIFLCLERRGVDFGTKPLVLRANRACFWHGTCRKPLGIIEETSCPRKRVHPHCI